MHSSLSPIIGRMRAYSDTIAPPRYTPRSALLRVQSDRVESPGPALAFTPTLTSVPRYASTPTPSVA